MPKETGICLHRQVWLKRSPRSLSPATSRPSCCGSSWPTPLAGVRNAPAPAPTTYGDFVATHPPLFTEAGEPLEADYWLRVMESKFGLLRCTKVQKTPSSRSSYVVTPVHGGPTTPPLSPWTTKCRGRSSVMLSAPTTPYV
jgi:hypothetical protein